MARPALRVIDGRSASYVSLPRYRVVEASMEGIALADELHQRLVTAYSFAWANRRTKTLLVISDLQASVAAFRRAAADLAGLAEAAEPEPPTERPIAPRRAPGRRRRDRYVAATARSA
jgi:hypothetical protein